MSSCCNANMEGVLKRFITIIENEIPENYMKELTEIMTKLTMNEPHTARPHLPDWVSVVTWLFFPLPLFLYLIIKTLNKSKAAKTRILYTHYLEGSTESH